jgi:hypothetical protein
MMEPVQIVSRQIWREGNPSVGSRSIGASVMVSVSAPTALAVRMADAAGITLAAIARADGFEVFTHRGRISYGAAALKTPSLEAVSMPIFQRSVRCESLSQRL